MQAHLDDGCAACIHANKLWGMVAELATREPSYEPPRDVIDAVKAEFPLARKMSVLPYIALPAKMTFDSAREPLPAGFRGGSADVRHLLYETVNFLIGLSLGRDELEGRITLTGQVVTRDAAKPVALDVKVLVTGDNGRLLRHLVANSLGEFQLELEEQKLLVLYIQLCDSGIASINLTPLAC